MQVWTGPEGSSRFPDNRRMKVVRSSALSTGRLYPLRNIPSTHFCYRMNRPQGQSVAAKTKSMKNPNEPIENRTRGLPAFNEVTQMQTVLLCLKYLSAIYHYPLRNNTEERSSQLLLGGTWNHEYKPWFLMLQTCRSKYRSVYCYCLCRILFCLQ